MTYTHCIYCKGPLSAAQIAAHVLWCDCDETPEYMRADAPPTPPARRCPDCGEFAADCECGGARRSSVEFGYGGRRANVGGED